MMDYLPTSIVAHNAMRLDFNSDAVVRKRRFSSGKTNA